MSFTIKDGTGKGFEAKVDSKNRLEVDAIAESPIQEATDDGDAYCFTSTYSATGGQEVLYLRNDSTTQHLHLAELSIRSQEASEWIFFDVTSTSAAGGTTGTVTNLNLGQGGFTARGTAFGSADVTGGLSGDTLYRFQVSADTTLVTPFDGGIRLNQGKAVALTLTTGTTNTVDLYLVFYYA